jgi:hypothetical protein
MTLTPTARPDSYYAEVQHFGLVAESWRGNVTVKAE